MYVDDQAQYYKCWYLSFGFFPRMWQIKIMKNQSNAGDIMQEWVFFLKENRPHTKAIMIWLGGGNVSKLVQVVH